MCVFLALYASFLLPLAGVARPMRKQAPKWKGSSAYACHVESALHGTEEPSIQSLQDVMRKAASESGATARQKANKQWDTEELKELRRRRRRCRVRAERTALSKEIAKKTRRALRNWQTQRLGEQLEKFRDLKNLGKIAAEPKQRKVAVQPPGEAFAGMLRELYSSSEVPGERGNLALLRDIEPFTRPELDIAMKALSKGKCADKHGLLLELLANGGESVRNTLLRKYQYPTHWGLPERLE